FLSMLSPPPRPTLFPYTTLFRSIGQAEYFRRFVECLAGCIIACSANHLQLKIAVHLRDHRVPPGNRETQKRERWKRLIDEMCKQDRKSTRLNSSHVKISYAVFCL